MPKIIDMVREAEAAGTTYTALEFFPPRTAEGVANLYKRCTAFAAQCEWPPADIRQQRAPPCRAL